MTDHPDPDVIKNMMDYMQDVHEICRVDRQSRTSRYDKNAPMMIAAAQAYGQLGSLLLEVNRAQTRVVLDDRPIRLGKE